MMKYNENILFEFWINLILEKQDSLTKCIIFQVSDKLSLKDVII